VRRKNCYGDSHIKLQQARRFRQEMTLSEQLLWSGLRGNRLMNLHFRRQHVIRGYIVDFYCHSAKVIVEIDGKIHDSRCEIDQFRETVLRSDGFSVLRFAAREVENNPDAVIGKIKSKCQELGLIS
jgi:very-short-patch-repair endonuclease